MSIVSDPLRIAAVLVALSQAEAKIYTGVAGKNHDVVLTANYNGNDKMTMEYDCGGLGKPGKGGIFQISLWGELETTGGASRSPSPTATRKTSGGSGSKRGSLARTPSKPGPERRQSLTRSGSSSSLKGIYDLGGSASSEEETLDDDDVTRGHTMVFKDAELKKFKEMCGSMYGDIKSKQMSVEIKDDQIQMVFFGAHVRLLRGRAPPLQGNFMFLRAVLEAQPFKRPSVTIRLDNGESFEAGFAPHTKDDSNNRLDNAVALDVEKSKDSPFKEEWTSFLKSYRDLIGDDMAISFDTLEWDSPNKQWLYLASIPLTPAIPTDARKHQDKQ